MSWITLFHSGCEYYLGNIRISWKYPRSVDIIRISRKYSGSVDIIQISWIYKNFMDTIGIGHIMNYIARMDDLSHKLGHTRQKPTAAVSQWEETVWDYTE